VKDAVSAVAEALRSSRKYRHLCPATLERAARRAIARHSRVKDAVRVAKGGLHQAHAAFVDTAQADRIEAFVDAMPTGGGPAETREACRRILALHASTRERLPCLDRFYRGLWEITGPPRAVLDLACGLSPFAFPWMELPAGATYRGLDADGRLVELARRFLARVPGDHAAVCADVLDLPPDPADVVLLLKTLPCLERQEKGAGLRMVAALRARWVVASFPTRSLGGRDRGMVRGYERSAEELSRALGTDPQVVRYPTETTYLFRGPEGR
jgi:16S rRNA (guanine(1405)-N(7))-methyltransferase